MYDKVAMRVIDCVADLQKDAQANAERNAACCISLPMFTELTAEEVDYVIEKTLEWDRTA